MEKKILTGMNILLVEEEVLIAMDLEQLFYDLGATAVATISSETKLTPEALDTEELQAQIRQADAAILDARVGEGSSMELARRLTTLGIPFVFATGYSRGEAFFDEFPGAPVVSKPYAAQDLVDAVASAVDRNLKQPQLSS